MISYVFDTNILINYLKGISMAIEILEKQSNPCISRITWIEVMVGVTADNKAIVEKFLQQFEIIEIDETIALKTAQIRQNYRIKLPDALIWATAKQQGSTLVTRNSKDFSPDYPDVVIPYTLTPH